MLTIKQLEAFFWVARLGTVDRAASKLHITQSAATKRLQELESMVIEPLFDSQRSKAKLSLKGQELLELCKDLLEGVAHLDELQSSTRSVARILQIGITELVATTWFPLFIRKMKEVYPNVVVQPELMHLSVELRTKVLDGSLDIAFVPETDTQRTLARVELNSVPFAWFCAPGLFPKDTPVTLQQLSSAAVIEQDERSIITQLCRRLFSEAGVEPRRVFGGSSVLAMAGLIEAGIGISCLPESIVSNYVHSGRLQMVHTRPPAPSLRYCTVFMNNPQSGIGYSIAEIARQCSNTA
ncbi:LysR family transcriptional regulator [Caballeronia glebae]|uniref:LysR family transcriptional regulator n=1 Tax=Caballeronia glebae TaxID=1777143 RepID=A0A158AZG1_9BURK|nr:LysR family transcriptional regulator [Caballeronia glebae]SAK63381.1 LysR family transcriptional regulator [Caballeronia glebae]